MTKKIKINNVEVSIEDFKKAMVENKELLEKKGGRVKRVKCGEYWYLVSGGDIGSRYDLFAEEDNYRYRTGNYFLTKQEAKDYKAYLEALGRVRLAILEANDGWEPNWGDAREHKHFIYYENHGDCLRSLHNYTMQCADELPSIKSDSIAELIIESHKDDLILIFNYKQ